MCTGKDANAVAVNEEIQVGVYIVIIGIFMFIML